MGREYRKDLTECILYCLISHKRQRGGISQLALKRKVKKMVPKFSSSTFHDRLKHLENLGFLSIYPADKVKTLVEPELPAYLYALYRIEYARKDSDNAKKELWKELKLQTGELLEKIRLHLIDHFVKHVKFLEKLYADNPETSALVKALNQLMTGGRDKKLSDALNEGLLIRLSKGIFEKHMETIDSTGMKRFKAFIDLNKFQEHFLSDQLELYAQLAKSLIEFISTETEQNISSFAEAWRLSLKDVFMSLPAGLKKLFLETVRGAVYLLYAESLQELPPHVRAEYEEKLSRTEPEEIALIFECPDCHNTSIQVKNIFDFLEKREVECERCGHKVLLEPHIDASFLRWAWETYIPKQLMSALTKIIGRMSVVVCNVLAYENKVLCGATSTIEVAIEPPHPGCAFELTLIDPDGSKQIYRFSTDNSSMCRWNYTFNKCGIWRIYASWPGDEDHIGTLSREVRVLVYE